MLSFEYAEPTESRCECCGNVTVRLTRFVRRNGGAYAVYYAQFTTAHAEKRLSGLIGLGDWSEEAKEEDRVAFPFQIWLANDNFVVGLTNASNSPWSHVTYLGRLLDREEALRHAWIKEVFHITDHMVTDDKAITNYFGASGA